MVARVEARLWRGAPCGIRSSQLSKKQEGILAIPTTSEDGLMVTQRFRVVIRIVLDFLVLVVAVVCAVLAENFAMARVFGIPAYAVRFGGRPGIWIPRFLEPLVALPILTLWLWRNGETWHKLGLRKPTSWRRFATHVMVTLLGGGALESPTHLARDRRRGKAESQSPECSSVRVIYSLVQRTPSWQV